MKQIIIDMFAPTSWSSVAWNFASDFHSLNIISPVGSPFNVIRQSETNPVSSPFNVTRQSETTKSDGG